MFSRLTRCLSILGIAGTLAAAPGTSHSAEYYVMTGVGTLGGGVSLVSRSSPNFGWRTEVNYMSFSDNQTVSGVNYSGQLSSESYGLLTDYYPAGTGFRFTTGLRYNDAGANLVGTPTGDVNLGGTTYSAADVGNLRADISTNRWAPYVGIGWTGELTRDGNWFINADLGVMYQGDPRVTTSATGALASDAQFRADLQSESSRFEDDLRLLSFYPVASVGLTYRF